MEKEKPNAFKNRWLYFFTFIIFAIYYAEDPGYVIGIYATLLVILGLVVNLFIKICFFVKKLIKKTKKS